MNLRIGKDTLFSLFSLARFLNTKHLIRGSAEDGGVVDCLLTCQGVWNEREKWFYINKVRSNMIMILFN